MGIENNTTTARTEHIKKSMDENMDRCIDSYREKPCCCAIGVFLIILGFAFFMGFYFGEIKPRDDKHNNTSEQGCYIHNARNVSRDCHKQWCNGCGCYTGDICASFVANKIEGNCCDHSCCRRRECRGGWDWDLDGNRYWDHCDTRVCVEHSTEACTVSWGTCWRMEVEFSVIEIDEEPTDVEGEVFSNIRLTTTECGYNDYRCVDRFMEKYKAQSTTTCWYNEKKDEVYWSNTKPAGDWWVGAGFGIAFMIIGFLAVVYPCLDSMCESIKRTRSFHLREEGEIVM